MRESADHIKYLRGLAERLKGNEAAHEQLHLIADHIEELAAAILMNNRLIAMTEAQTSKEEVESLWNTIRELRQQMVTKLDLEAAMMEGGRHRR